MVSVSWVPRTTAERNRTCCLPDSALFMAAATRALEVPGPRAQGSSLQGERTGCGPSRLALNPPHQSRCVCGASCGKIKSGSERDAKTRVSCTHQVQFWLKLLIALSSRVCSLHPCLLMPPWTRCTHQKRPFCKHMRTLVFVLWDSFTASCTHMAHTHPHTHGAHTHTHDAHTQDPAAGTPDARSELRSDAAGSRSHHNQACPRRSLASLSRKRLRLKAASAWVPGACRQDRGPQREAGPLRLRSPIPERRAGRPRHGSGWLCSQ